MQICEVSVKKIGKMTANQVISNNMLVDNGYMYDGVQNNEHVYTKGNLSVYIPIQRINDISVRIGQQSYYGNPSKILAHQLNLPHPTYVVHKKENKPVNVSDKVTADFFNKSKNPGNFK